MPTLTPPYELGKDVQYFLTPMYNPSGTWTTLGTTFALQARVEDVEITPAFQTESISPLHVFNTNPIVFEAGATIEITEARVATTNVAAGSIGLPRGNILEAASLMSFIQKLEVKRFDKTGAEITAQKITFLCTVTQQPTKSSKSGNKASMTLSTIAVFDSATGLELSNPYYGASAPF